MRVWVRRVGFGRRSRGGLAIATALSLALTVADFAAAEPVTVLLDQAKVLHIPDRTSTVVVGNPLIADISVQSGGLIVVTGKGYGITNLIALDNRGNTLLEQLLEVRAPSEHIVAVQRGMERESYSCTPNCERRITLGDSPAFFDATLTQTGRRDGQAQGSGSNESRGR